MPAYSINCSGRRYPNAPVQTKSWCLERQPPYYFFPFTGGFTGIWASINGTFVPCRYETTFSFPNGRDPNSIWAWPEGSTERNVFVYLADFDGPPAIEVHYRTGGVGGIRGLVYYRAFPSGFPKWPEFYQIDHHLTYGNWTYGVPAIVNLWTGYYAFCPVDLCLPQ